MYRTHIGLTARKCRNPFTAYVDTILVHVSLRMDALPGEFKKLLLRPRDSSAGHSVAETQRHHESDRPWYRCKGYIYIYMYTHIVCSLCIYIYI